jgi:ATP-binding cassette subfamily B protein
MGDIYKEQEFDKLLSGKIFDKNRPFKTLIYLFKDNIGKILLSFLFYAIKHSPAWIMPIVIGNVIDIATARGSRDLKEMWINLAVAIILIVQNLPTNVLYTKFFSQALRKVEADLRSKLVRKLQMLSISYHKEMKSGKIQSKILRDVEAITVLSRQFCNGVIPIIMNIVVALAITLSKSFTVSIFFILSIPLSAFIIKFFRSNIRKTNSDFRKELEEMSAKVAEMVEMIPITKAHGLEKVEIQKIDTQLEKVKDSGYKLDIVNAFSGLLPG